MAAVVAVTALVGGAVGAMGAIKEGQAKEAAANQNAVIQDYNRDVSLRNRGVVASQTDADMRDAQKEGERNLSSIRAAYGANGLALSGSPTDVIIDQSKEKALDVEKIGYKGDVQVAGYTDEAANYGMKANLYRQEASFAPQIAELSATSKFLGGVSGAAKAFSGSAGGGGDA